MSATTTPAPITRRALKNGCPECGDHAAVVSDLQAREDGNVRQVFFVRCLNCGIEGSIIRRGPWLGVPWGE